MEKMSQVEALAAITTAAVASEKATGVPAELTAAQCIFESGWLKVAPGNNCFGIKDTDRLPGSQYFLTKEYINGQWHQQRLAFEVYPSLAACFEDHGGLLASGKPYREAFKVYQSDKDLKKLCYAVASRYATAPTYGDMIWQMATSTNLTAALAAARKEKV